MPSVVGVLLYLAGLAMFWLYFRISLDESPVPDQPQYRVPADEYGEVLTDEELGLLRRANELHGYSDLEEDYMCLDAWRRVLDIVLKSFETGRIGQDDIAELNEWAAVLCNDFINHERNVAGLDGLPGLDRPWAWEHWEIAGTLVRVFWEFLLSVAGKAISHHRTRVTSQDLYELDAEFRTKGYWGRVFMWPVSRDGEGERFDGHLEGTVREGRMKGFRMRSKSCPAVVARADLRVVEACFCWQDDCPYREKKAKAYGVDVSMLDEWRKLDI